MSRHLAGPAIDVPSNVESPRCVSRAPRVGAERDRSGRPSSSSGDSGTSRSHL
jgi:hypothetical protein